MSQDKMRAIADLNRQIAQRQGYNQQKAESLKAREMRLQGGMGANADAQSLNANLQSLLPEDLVPGNVGDINKIIWPFFFRSNFTGFIVPGQSITTSFSVTQEASFIWMSFVRVVYTVTNAGLANETRSYIDPNTASPDALLGLTVTFRDAQSTREFVNTPIDLSQMGLPRFPFKFPRPTMLLPNANMEMTFTNNAASGATLAPVVIALGYRLRVENATDILSLVSSR